MSHELPLWRALLFVPANKPEYLKKVPASGADGVVLDLEDSIAAAEKVGAREVIPAMLDELGKLGIDTLVRINRPWRLAVRDLEAVVRDGLKAIMLPMVDSAAHVREVSQVIAELEEQRSLEPGAIKLCLVIEDATGFQDMREIANADERAIMLFLGVEDFSHCLGITPTTETMKGAVQKVVTCAAEAGLLPFGLVGSVSDIHDTESYRHILELSRRLGLRGAACIHPDQVRSCQRAFAPGESEIAEARGIVQAFDEALSRGDGAVMWQGKMIDKPIAERARKLLDQLF